MGRGESVLVGVYSRQSKDKTKSIDEQTAECEADALDQDGWVIAQRYSDGVSASRFAKAARKDWPRLLADIDAGRLHVLALWESSRGDRTPESWLALLSKCRERRVLIRVTTHERTYDMRVARDWKALAEDGIDSAYESEKTSVRLKRAVAAGARAGRPHGRVIYGYERVYDPATRALVEQRPHPDRAPVVAEIFARISRGEAISKIVRDLNDRGIPGPRGGRWERNTVRGIALNVEYTGVRELRGETYPAIWPAIVDPPTFLAARRILTDPTRATSRPGAQRWLLSHLAYCVCGAPMQGVPWRETKPLRDRYVCRRYARGCSSIVAGTLGGDDIDGIDPLITEMVVRYLARPDGPALRRSDDAEVLAARKEAEEATARLDEWRDSAARGETSPASLARIEAQLLEQIRSANRRAAAASWPAVLVDVLDGAEGREDVIRARFGRLAVEQRREIIAMLVDIRVKRASSWGSHRFDPDRVEVTWK